MTRSEGSELTAFLAGGGAVDDAAIDAFLERAKAHPDAKAARSAVAEVIQSPRISLAQLERIARSDPALMKRHEALIRRTYLGRRIQEGVDDELLEQVIRSGDASVQTRLVRDPRLTRKQAEALARGAVNPTIRENAAAWVKDKKAWR